MVLMSPCFCPDILIKAQVCASLEHRKSQKSVLSGKTFNLQDILFGRRFLLLHKMSIGKIYMLPIYATRHVVSVLT